MAATAPAQVAKAREFSTATRKKHASRGIAMPDGSYPIPDKDALSRAIQSYGRASDPAAVKRHIMKRARALGATSMLPDSWKKSAAAALADQRLSSGDMEARVTALELAALDGTAPMVAADPSVFPATDPGTPDLGQATDSGSSSSDSTEEAMAAQGDADKDVAEMQKEAKDGWQFDDPGDGTYNIYHGIGRDSTIRVERADDGSYSSYVEDTTGAVIGSDDYDSFKQAKSAADKLVRKYPPVKAQKAQQALQDVTAPGAP